MKEEKDIWQDNASGKWGNGRELHPDSAGRAM